MHAPQEKLPALDNEATKAAVTAQSPTKKPSELRSALNDLKEAIANIGHFREVTSILSQILDNFDVKMLGDERAKLLGRITAADYVAMMATLVRTQVLADAGFVDTTKQQLAEDQMNQLLEATLPDYMLAYNKKIAGQPIAKVLDETHHLLTDLNAKILVEFNPTLPSTKYAISFALEKIYLLRLICSQQDLAEKLLALQNFLTNQVIETLQFTSELFGGEVKVNKFIELMKLCKKVPQIVSNAAENDNVTADKADITESELAKMLISLISIEYAMTEFVQINQIKMQEVSTEFYEAVQFSQKPTPEQQAKLMAAMPKIIRVLLATMIQPLTDMAWMIDEDHFIENLFEVIQDQAMRADILNTVFERTLLMNPENMPKMLELAEAYCQQNANVAAVDFLKSLTQQYKQNFVAQKLTLEIPSTKVVALQQASFSKFLNSAREAKGASADLLLEDSAYSSEEEEKADSSFHLVIKLSNYDTYN